MKEAYSYKGCSITDTMPLMIKDIDGRKGIITGYFSMFDSVDSDGDVMKKGCFAKTLKEQGPNSVKPRIKHLLNHDPSKPLGVIYELKEDNTGLYYESKLGTHSLGEDFVKMVDSGLVTENSFGFQTVKQTQLMPWNEWKPGEAAREILEVRLFEGSNLTAWGANHRTYNSGVKGAVNPEQVTKRIEILLKAYKNGTFTDDTFELIEIELKQLQQLFIDLSKKEPVEETTLTEPEKKSTQSQKLDFDVMLDFLTVKQ